MRIIARSAAKTQSNWHEILANSIRSGQQLLQQLQLSNHPELASQAAENDFPVLVPRPWLELMKPADPLDPLLLQVLPQAAETLSQPGYVSDPLGEIATNVQPGIIHKYQGRLLLIAATGCAVNCRYCFRRHFDYADNRLSRQQWQQSLDYVRNNPEISEVILSGGDPLMLKDVHLAELVSAIEAIPHVKRLRIHSRLPVVIPARITESLTAMLASSRLDCVLVLHINHPQEISAELQGGVTLLKQHGITLLNQSVLLKGINDQADILVGLSEKLFQIGILPYYLHLLDKVAGAQHFDMPLQQAQALYQQLHARLPGYLLPRLAQEESGMTGKTLIPLEANQGNDSF
ncbi:EF-P beta-lysylation protein EpmB [Oceanobacter mangrovi]|uniref:EF-P beta-lysylation protein EpmB n=1 Tax=Oceanobacter mangrovi TaxID=2862510 RepID=UPI0031BA6E51